METQSLQGVKQIGDFCFMPSTNGLGSKSKGMPKIAISQKANTNVNQLD
jgi:hypothetical protein